MTGRADAVPLYVRALRLRHLRPGGAQCFLLFETMIAIGALLALAELVPWWGVLALPGAVAAMVKINDVIAGTGAQAGRVADPTDEWAGAHRAGDLAFGVAGSRSPAVRWRVLDDRRAPAEGGSPPVRSAARDDQDPARPRWISGTGRAGEPRRRDPGGYGRAVGRAAVRPATPTPPVDAGARPAEENTTLGLAHALNGLPVGGSADSPQQRARQSAVRRYE